MLQNDRMSQAVHAGLRNCERLCTCIKCPLLKREWCIYGTILMCMTFSSKWSCFMLSAADCESDWRNWTLPHHKHHFWLRSLLLGQKHCQKAPELPGNLGIVLRLRPPQDSHFHTDYRSTVCFYSLFFFFKLWSVFSKTFHPGGSSSCMFSLPNWTEPSKETWTPRDRRGLVQPS